MELTSSVAEAAANLLPVFATFFSAFFSFCYRVTFLIGSSSSSPSMASLDLLLFFIFLPWRRCFDHRQNRLRIFGVI